MLQRLPGPADDHTSMYFYRRKMKYPAAPQLFSCRIAFEVHSGEQTRCGNDSYCPFCFSESFFWSTHTKPALTRLVKGFWSRLHSLLLLLPWFASDRTSSSQLNNSRSPKTNNLFLSKAEEIILFHFYPTIVHIVLSLIILRLHF